MQLSCGAVWATRFMPTASCILSPRLEFRVEFLRRGRKNGGGRPFPRNRPAKSVRKCVRGKAISILQAARIPWKRFIGLSCEGAIASNGRCRSDSCALPAIATLPSLFPRLYDMDIATVHSNPRVKLSPRFGYPTFSTSLFAAAVAETMNVESPR